MKLLACSICSLERPFCARGNGALTAEPAEPCSRAGRLSIQSVGGRCQAAEFRAGFLPRSLHPNAVRGNSIAANPSSALG